MDVIDMMDEMYDKIEFDDCCFPLKYTVGKRIEWEDISALNCVKWHEELELKFFRKGGAVLQIGTDILTAQSGDILICNPCDPHCILEVDGFAEYDVVVFNVVFLANKFDKTEDVRYIKPLLDGRMKFKHLIRGDERLVGSVNLFFSELAQTAENRQLAITGLLLYIFSLLFDGSIDEIADNSLAERAEKVKRIQASVEYINKNYDKNISLEQIAGESALVPIYFSKLFKEVMGITVGEYLKTVRLSKAEKLLLSTKEKVSSIAAACGFEDPCYFNRWFKENNGVTPGEYRNQKINNKEIIMEKLAMYGGEKVKTTPYGEGKRFGAEELAELKEALDQNTLFYFTPGAKKVRKLTAKLAELYGTGYCVATSSGTAAVHVALGAIGITAGDEVITTPITDMGTIIGILAQNAIPVFADVDPHNYNIDPASIEKCITDKTKAVIVVHLAGVPCDMDAIMEVARRHNIKVIEDCCQAFMCKYKGKYVGTIGDVGCFSFNEFKHVVAGDGGAVLVNDEDMYYKCHRFADKEYDRYGKEMRKIPFLAPNYRMNELTASCVLGQLTKADFICGNHTKIGDAITEGIKDLPGVSTYQIDKDSTATYLWYMFRIDEKVLGVSREEFVKALQEEGIAAGAGYIAECVYMYDMFQNKSAYQDTNCPFNCKYYSRDIEYPAGLAPVAEEILKTAVRLPVNEFFTEEDVEQTIRAIRKVVNYYINK